ncbi:transporter substrate-binding domain-containing protein [Megamonas hypermegale]|uniref:transporter substrate-binding domain-containing protein n=1 Tax=Megamonas hypermegale TaxID=158847 RepID=UPI00255CABF6|nr:transporter substrate-binding domain-containing protein [Megamonas hypermegale]
MNELKTSWEKLFIKYKIQQSSEEWNFSGDGYDAKTFDPATWTTGVKFKQYDDYPAISTALSAGDVDAFCVDKSILAIYNTDGRSYIEEEFAPQEYGIATKKGSGLSKVAEDFVQKSLKDGTIDTLITENNLK